MLDQLADSVRRLLATVRRGDVVASPATVHRLEGALVALGAALGAVEEPLRALLDEPLFIGNERLHDPRSLSGAMIPPASHR